MSYDGGSFRDPDGRVFLEGGAVRRALSARGAEEWGAVSRAAFFKAAVAAGRVVGSREVAPPEGWAAALEHDRVPLVSYPYEWGFAQLQDAALLTLDLELSALAEGFTLKDGTPYNVQFVGASPVFIDVGSFERLRPGAVWAGYRQFCEQFLYPLMLRAYKGLPFAPWLRGRLEGIPAADAARLLGLRGALRPGVFSHVVLQSRLQERHAGEDGDLRAELAAAGAGAEVVAAGLRRLRALVAGLAWRPPASAWSEYGRGEHYGAQALQAKESFVREAVEAGRRSLAWDLGANRGHYARVLASCSRTVAALDADDAAHERLYLDLRSERERRILPLRLDLADPSPGLGWRGRERARLEDRGRPDFVLALAVLHHLRLTAGVPAAELAGWLGALGAEAVVEFVPKDDPAASRLLARKDDRYEDWTSAAFEAALAPLFATVRRLELPGSGRLLLHLRPRRP